MVTHFYYIVDVLLGDGFGHAQQQGVGCDLEAELHTLGLAQLALKNIDVAVNPYGKLVEEGLACPSGPGRR